MQQCVCGFYFTDSQSHSCFQMLLCGHLQGWQRAILPIKHQGKKHNRKMIHRKCHTPNKGNNDSF